MKKSELINKLGCVTEVARLFGIRPQAVSRWNEDIPKARLWQLKLLRPNWFKKKFNKDGLMYINVDTTED